MAAAPSRIVSSAPRSPPPFFLLKAIVEFKIVETATPPPPPLEADEHLRCARGAHLARMVWMNGWKPDVEAHRPPDAREAPWVPAVFR